MHLAVAACRFQVQAAVEVRKQVNQLDDKCTHIHMVCCCVSAAVRFISAPAGCCGGAPAGAPAGRQVH
jgi:hypothetical protein